MHLLALTDSFFSLKHQKGGYTDRKEGKGRGTV
jgi:hypothetical protein